MDFDPAFIDDSALQVCAKLEAAGFPSWVVGGCVRDALLGKAVSDWDVCTTARPEQVKQVFPRVIDTGLAHGTVTVLLRGESFEVTTLRGEGTYTDGRRPDEVFFVDDIHDDLARRDFTVNAIAYRPATGQLEDPFGGRVDLEARVLRAVGVPAERFAEDGLRILRGARFVASLGMTLEPATEAAFTGALSTFARVSRERIRDEWLKAFRAERPSDAFLVMRRTGILSAIEPRLGELNDAEFLATCARLDQAPHELRFAAFFSAYAASFGLPYVDHTMKLLKATNDERVHGVRLLTLLLTPAPAQDGGSLRRVLHNAGELWQQLLALQSCYDVPPGFASSVHFEEWAKALRAEASLKPPVTLKQLEVTGDDVAAVHGKGKIVGEVLKSLLDRVIEEPSSNEREKLLQWISCYGATK